MSARAEGAALGEWLHVVALPERRQVTLPGKWWCVGEPVYLDGGLHYIVAVGEPRPTRLASEYTTDVWVEAE